MAGVEESPEIRQVKDPLVAPVTRRGSDSPAVGESLDAHGSGDNQKSGTGSGGQQHAGIIAAIVLLERLRGNGRKETNPDRIQGSADAALAGADVYIGLSAPGAVTVDGIRSMADNAIVFAMANPTPELEPEEIGGPVAVVGTGRSDYPNQIKNVLAFPGISVERLTRVQPRSRRRWSWPPLTRWLPSSSRIIWRPTS